MRLRSVIAGLLVFLGCVTALAAVPVRWIDQQVHSDGYAETIRPLVKEPQVQAALADLVLNAAGQTGQQLPPQAEPIVKTQVANVLSTPAAGDLWVTANLAARDAVVNGSGDQVSINVDELAGQLRGPLQEELRPFNVRVPELPANAGRVVLLDSPIVGQARDTIQLTSTLAGILPWLAIGLLAVALVVSPRRGRTLVAAGFGIGIPTLVAVLMLTLAEGAAVAAFGDSQTQPFILALYEAFAGSLRADLLWLLLACGLAVVGGFVLSAVTGRRRREDESRFEGDDPYRDYREYPPASSAPQPYGGQQQPYQQRQPYGQQPPHGQQQQQPYGQQQYPGEQQQPRY